MGEKKTRFRFSEAEKLAAIQETINYISVEITIGETELWDHIHAALVKENPRFVACSKRLLKDHILEQVLKFKKFNSEDIESGKEKLKTEWGIKMKNLMNVWNNYEDLVQMEVTKRSQKPGKEVSQTKNDFDAAKFLRDAAVEVVKNNMKNVYSFLEVKINDEPHSNSNSPLPITSPYVYAEEVSVKRKRTKKNNFDSLLWKSFFEKSKMECESRERIEEEKQRIKMIKLEMEERMNKEKQQTERAKLELEMRKLEFEKQKYEEEKQQKQLTNQLLTELLKSTLLKK